MSGRLFNTTHVYNHSGAPTNVRVTIGMPVYNGDRYIPGALNSLLAQTFADFELIISDNASTDRTEAICQEYARREPRIRYIRQKDNLGVLANFEFVFQQSNSIYFMWAAHDDEWHTQFLERCVTALDDDSSRALAFGRWVSISRRLPWLRITAPENLDCLQDHHWRPRVVGYLSLSNNFHKANLVYALWRRDILDSTRLIHMCALSGTEAHVGQDMALCTAALFRGKAYIDKDVLFFKKYKNSPPGHWACHIEALATRIVSGNEARMRHLAAEQVASEEYQRLVRSVLLREGLSALESDAILHEAWPSR